MGKMDHVLCKMGSVSPRYAEILNDLQRHDSLTGEEKIACEERIIENFELEKQAFMGLMRRGGSWLLNKGKGLFSGAKNWGSSMGNKLKSMFSKKPVAQGSTITPQTKSIVPYQKPNQALTNTATPVSSAGGGGMGNWLRGKGQAAQNWMYQNPGLATAGSIAGAGILGGGAGAMMARGGGGGGGGYPTQYPMRQPYPYRKFGSYEEKTAAGGEWTKALAAGVISSVPVSILAAIGYKNLKEDMAKHDVLTQQQLGNIGEDMSSVGAAADLYSLNQMYGDGQGQGQGMGQGMGQEQGQGQGQGMSPDYASYNPQDFAYKQSMLEDPDLIETFDKIAQHSSARKMLLEQVGNPEISKEAQDLAGRLVGVNRGKLVEALKELVSC